VTVRVALVDDHPVFRSGLRALLTSVDDFDVVAEAESARQAYEVVESKQPDLVVLDLNLPGTSGIIATRELMRRQPRARVLVLSMYTDPSKVSEALAAGAAGYAFKSDPPEVLLNAARAVMRGERWVPPQVATLIVEGKLARQAGGSVGALSAREREVFDLLVRGFSNRAVANELCISIKTVETHRAQIHRKLGVHSVAQLIRYAAVNGLMEQ
jgi:DNA-binding NarL/FixJ family response regulator